MLIFRGLSNVVLNGRTQSISDQAFKDIFGGGASCYIPDPFGAERFNVLCLIVGLAVCYTFGTTWFVLMYAAVSGPIGVMSALWSCVIPFLIPDGIKLALALVLSRRLVPLLAKA